MGRRVEVAGGDVAILVEEHRVNRGGPGVLFVHATGFCGQVWQPVIEEAAAAGANFDAIVIDQRGHGGSSSFPHPLRWWDLADDVLTALQGRSQVLGVGHSSGGAAIAMAEMLAPGTFCRMILIEPIIPRPPFERQDYHPLAVGALKRRRSFASRREAAASYQGRGPFRNWDERAFNGYIAGALEPDPEAGGEAVRLACSPENEAEYYRSAYEHRAWKRLDDLAAPVEIIVGENSDTHPPDYVALLAAGIPNAEVTWIADTDHFVPMQQPGRIAELVVAAIAE